MLAGKASFYNAAEKSVILTNSKLTFDSTRYIEEIVIVYIRNGLIGTFACACNTLRLRLILLS